MSTLPPGKKIVNRHVINDGETLCTFTFVYNSDPNNQGMQGMIAYPQEGDSTPVKIRDLVIKSKGIYEYYDNNGNRNRINPKNIFAIDAYAMQQNKYTDGALTQEEVRKLELRGGSKRKSKSQRRKKSKSQRRKKSIKRRH
jgi:hypothetical protein